MGEADVLICTIVLITTFGVERLIFKQAAPDALRSLGLGYSSLRTMLVAILICVIFLAFYPVFSVATGAKLTLRDNWIGVLLGLLVQAGMAEEVLLRGYLFGHLRKGNRSGGNETIRVSGYNMTSQGLLSSSAMEMPRKLAVSGYNMTSQGLLFANMGAEMRLKRTNFIPLLNGYAAAKIVRTRALWWSGGTYIFTALCD